MSALAKTPMVDPSVATGPQFDNRRVAAAFIDLLVPLALGSAAYAAGLSFTRGLALVVAAWTLYYFFALESGDGQTLGKRIMNLRVVSADGRPASMGQIAKRTVVRIVDGNVLGLIVMLATGDRRMRLGDIVAGTVVTDAEAAPTAAEAPIAAAPAAAEPSRRRRSGPSLPKPALRKPSFGKPSFSRSSPRRSEPPAEKLPLHKRPLSLPSLRRKRTLSPQAEAARVPAVPASFAPPEPAAEKLPFHKRSISLPSFGRRSKTAGAGAMGQTAGPAPAAAPPQAAPAPTFDAPARPEPARPEPARPEPARPEPVPYEPEPHQPDRLADALRASEAPQVEPFEPFSGPEPVVELDGPDPEPVVELDRPAPEVAFDVPEPLVEYDREEPDPLADLGDREPVVEVDEPSPQPDSQAELEPWAEPRVHATDPAGDPIVEGEYSAPDDAVEESARSAHDAEPDPDMTIKPVETVSAIDLVMQDAEQRRPARD